MASSSFNARQLKAIEEFKSEINSICKTERVSFDVKIEELRNQYCGGTQDKDFLKKAGLNENAIKQVVFYEKYHGSKAEECIKIVLADNVEKIDVINMALNAGGCAALHECNSEEYIIFRTALKYILPLKMEYKGRMSSYKTVALFNEMLEIGRKNRDEGVEPEETIGQRLRMCRKRLGMTQEAVAEKINRNNRSISDYENDYRDPGIYVLQELADVLGTTVFYLVEGDKRNLGQDTTQLVSLYESIVNEEIRVKVMEIVRVMSQ